jgi:hypothetical protein
MEVENKIKLIRKVLGSSLLRNKGKVFFVFIFKILSRDCFKIFNLKGREYLANIRIR